MKRFPLAVLSLSLMSGCASLQGVPSAEPFQDATLKKAKSAQHWNVIANDVVAQTAGMNKGGKPLYVSPTDDSAFSKGFHSFLVSGLVNNGIAVSTKPDGAAKVTYEAQVVRHIDGRANHFAPGEIAALAGGVYVAREIGTSGASRSAQYAGGAAVVAAADIGLAYAKLYGPTNTEVIVSTSITDGDRYVMRKTDVYYIEDVEGAMFETPFRAQTKTVEVTGK